VCVFARFRDGCTSRLSVENSGLSSPSSRGSRRHAAAERRRFWPRRVSGTPRTRGVEGFLSRSRRLTPRAANHTVARRRHRTTRTRDCACRSRPASHGRTALACGVRPEKSQKPRNPRVRGVRLTQGRNTTPLRGCVPATATRDRGGRSVVFHVSRCFPYPAAAMFLSTCKRDVHPRREPQRGRWTFEKWLEFPTSSLWFSVSVVKTEVP